MSVDLYLLTFWRILVPLSGTICMVHSTTSQKTWM